MIVLGLRSALSLGSEMEYPSTLESLVEDAFGRKMCLGGLGGEGMDLRMGWGSNPCLNTSRNAYGLRSDVDV
jgi:hypothetical protein